MEEGFANKFTRVVKVSLSIHPVSLSSSSSFGSTVSPPRLDGVKEGKKTK